MEAWMVYGPFNLSDASAAELTFYEWLGCEEGDYLYYAASGDGRNFYGPKLTGVYLSWRSHTLDLTNVPDLGNLCGDASVWIAFVFTSDINRCGAGAFIDDVVLRKYVTPSDYTPPVISDIQESSDPIYRQGCASPTTITISARVTDAGSGVASVWLWYAGGGVEGNYAQMSYAGQNRYQATIGTFAQLGSIPYVIEASDNSGNSGDSAQYSFTVQDCALGTPSLNVIDNADCNDSYTVSWSTVTGALSYQLQEDDNASFSSPSVSYQGAARSTSISGRSAGTYYYRVRACHGSACGSWSSAQSARVWPVPAAPTLYPIDNPDCGANWVVSWSAVSNATSYELQLDASSAFSQPSAYTYYSTSCSIGAASPMTSYYRVRACNCRGCGNWSATRSASYLTAPVLQPIDNSDCDSSYSLVFSSIASATRYEVQEDDNPSFTSPLTLTPAGTTYTRYNQAAGTYYYRVRAATDSCSGPWSSSQSVRVWAVPAAPNLQPIDNSDCDQYYSLSWSAVADATSYQIWSSENPSMSGSVMDWEGSSTSVNVDLSDEYGTLYHQVRACNCRGCSPFSSVRSVSYLLPAYIASIVCTDCDGDPGTKDCDGDYSISLVQVPSATVYELEEDDHPGFSSPITFTLQPGQVWSTTDHPAGTFYYRARARTANCSGPWGLFRLVKVWPIPARPNLLISNLDCNQAFTLSWTDLSDISYYQLQEGEDPIFSQPVTVYSGTLASQSLHTHRDGTFYYRVRGCNCRNCGLWSETQATSALSAPSLDPILNEDCDGDYTISFSNIPGASRYELWEDVDPSFSNPVDYSLPPGTCQLIRDHSAGTFYYKVRAVSQWCCGPWSNTEQVQVSLRLLGETDCAWGSRDCNPCVKDVVASFNRLQPQGDILAYHLGGQPDPSWTGHWWNDDFWSDPSIGEGYTGHWQGVQRLMVGDGRYMVVTLDDVEHQGGHWSAFEVVRMGSRDGTGERWRSNRLAPTTAVNDTAPPAADLAVATAYIDPDKKHPGSPQSLGEYLVVGTGTNIHWYDLRNPEAPCRVGPHDPTYPQAKGPILMREGKSGSSSAAAKLSDGRYILVVASSDAHPLDFYVSTQPSLLESTNPAVLDTIQFVTLTHEWDKQEALPGGEPLLLCEKPPHRFCWDAFQSISLVTDCDSGKLYLVATSNWNGDATCYPDWLPKIGGKCQWDGSEYASLYAVRYVPSDAAVQLEKVAEKRFDGWYGYKMQGSEKHYNLDAAGGVYVDPLGQLYLYSTEHGSHGPQNTVKFTEFRPVPHGSCDTPEEAWVALYEHPDYGGQSVMIDYVDRDLKDYSDYDNVEFFNNLASSVRWCLPPGEVYHLVKHAEPCRGKHLPLYGTGKLEGIPKLKAVGFNDAASCSWFGHDPPAVVEFDGDQGTVYVHGWSWIPYEGGSAAALDLGQERTTTIEIPAEAVSGQATLIFTPRFPPGHATAPLSAPGVAFDLDIEIGGEIREGLVFAKPVTISLRYSDFEAEGFLEETFQLGYWDSGSQQWIPAHLSCGTGTTSLEPEDNLLVSSVCRTGEFALLANLHGALYMPVIRKAH
jgi:hypothetical protein